MGWPMQREDYQPFESTEVGAVPFLNTCVVDDHWSRSGTLSPSEVPSALAVSDRVFLTPIRMAIRRQADRQARVFRAPMTHSPLIPAVVRIAGVSPGQTPLSPLDRAHIT
jgi:hypothetical protein